MGIPTEMVGKTFGRLRVLALAPSKSSHGHYLYFAICECGTFTRSNGSRLRSGSTQSCGCLQKERTSAAVKKHGKRWTTEYSIWLSMKGRCENPKNAHYKNYGGRGVDVSDSWKYFENFLADMGQRPSKKHELDRIDNNGAYEKGNVRWTLRYVNSRNTRQNVWVEYKGLMLCLSDAAKAAGFKQQTISKRYAAGDREEKLFRPVPVKD